MDLLADRQVSRLRVRECRCGENYVLNVNVNRIIYCKTCLFALWLDCRFFYGNIHYHIKLTLNAVVTFIVLLFG